MTNKNNEKTTIENKQISTLKKEMIVLTISVFRKPLKSTKTNFFKRNYDYTL